MPWLNSGGGWYGGKVDPRSIDWRRVDIRNFEIYQPPRPNNVLGHIKFVFPNKHDVYMHDATLRNYYGQSYRAESPGCLRVQNPDHLPSHC